MDLVEYSGVLPEDGALRGLRPMIVIGVRVRFMRVAANSTTSFVVHERT